VCGQDAQSENSDSIHGTAVNSVTHEPVARALVFSQDNRFAPMTDSQDRFEFTFPQAANHQGSSAAAAGPLFRQADQSSLTDAIVH
jgi:hypothetical protein